MEILESSITEYGYTSPYRMTHAAEELKRKISGFRKSRGQSWSVSRAESVLPNNMPKARVALLRSGNATGNRISCGFQADHQPLAK